MDCQRAWLDPFRMGLKNIKINPLTPIRISDGRRPIKMMPKLCRMDGTIIPTIRLLGPPQALIVRVPASIPNPTRENIIPMVSAPVIPRSSGTISGLIITPRKLSDAKKINRPNKPLRAVMYFHPNAASSSREDFFSAVSCSDFFGAGK